MAQAREAGTDEKQALREATARAEKAEAELATLKAGIAGSEHGRADVAESHGLEVGASTIDENAGEAELRKDSMMAHLLDSLAAAKDIGHYGRLVFAMVARHFMSDDQLLGWLMRDPDFTEEQARVMVRQVEGRDYNPPKRERILEWQTEQEFPILPHPEDPDCGNLYRNLKFPDTIYRHIEHYQELKAGTE